MQFLQKTTKAFLPWILLVIAVGMTLVSASAFAESVEEAPAVVEAPVVAAPVVETPAPASETPITPSAAAPVETVPAPVAPAPAAPAVGGNEAPAAPGEGCPGGSLNGGCTGSDYDPDFEPVPTPVPADQGPGGGCPGSALNDGCTGSDYDPDFEPVPADPKPAKPAKPSSPQPERPISKPTHAHVAPSPAMAPATAPATAPAPYHHAPAQSLPATGVGTAAIARLGIALFLLGSILWVYPEQLLLRPRKKSILPEENDLETLEEVFEPEMEVIASVSEPVILMPAAETKLQLKKKPVTLLGIFFFALTVALWIYRKKARA